MKWWELLVHAKKDWSPVFYMPLKEPRYNSQLQENHCAIFNGILSQTICGILLAIVTPNFTIFNIDKKHNLSSET